MHAKIQFLQWLRKNDPFLYRVILHYDLNKKGDAKLGSWGTMFTSAIEAVKNIAPAALDLSAQRKIINLQIERAKAGLPPLDTAAYTPSVKIAAEITPETEAAAGRVAKQAVNEAVKGITPTILMLGGALGVLYFVFGRR